jgi:hypothetical protein
MPTTEPAEYKHEWVIEIKADDLSGAIDAIMNCLKAWDKGNEPIGGCCPESMGNRMTYDVRKTKSPDGRNVLPNPDAHAPSGFVRWRGVQAPIVRTQQ